MIVKPNFFIVGAPKCGTTALNEYLKQHPDIFMPDSKEINYFGSDLQFRKKRITEADYLKLFEGWNGQKCIGEASVRYLYSALAAQEIKAFSPEGRIIIMLRDPVEMLYSYYYQMLYNGAEDLPTFEEALAAEEDRRRGERIPASTGLIDGLYYRKMVQYTEQVSRFFDAFGREQVHIIIYDDFKTNTPLVFRNTLEFLQVDPTFSTELKVINPNKDVRSAAVRDFFKAPPLWFRLVFRIGRWSVPGAVRKRWNRRIQTAVQDWNTVYRKRPPMNPEIRCQLQAEFLPEIEKLSRLLDRDLTHWCKEGTHD